MNDKTKMISSVYKKNSAFEKYSANILCSKTDHKILIAIKENDTPHTNTENTNKSLRNKNF